MLFYERKLQSQGYDLVIGVDEAGRGPLAGPVVAAAVFLKTFEFTNRIDDSKKLSAKSRAKAFFEIKKNAIFGISVVSHQVVDKINILQASRLAMQRAVISLVNKINPLARKGIFVIADGNMCLDIQFPYKSIIKGDTKSLSIAAASILAKVSRDRIMDNNHKLYPGYGFDRHKGYPTKEHFLNLFKIGPCSIHRKSFLKFLQT